MAKGRFEPQAALSLKHLRRGIEEGKYKWLYTNDSYNEEETCKYLINNDIDLRECWRIIDDQMFRKIRNGLFEERTPPTNKGRVRKLSK